MDELKETANIFLVEIMMHQCEFNDFKALYYKSEKRIKLINSISAPFFGRLFWIYVDRIILNVCKIAADPAESCGRNNLSLSGLENVFLQKRIIIPEEKAGEANVYRNTLTEISLELKSWRNKKISHLDMNVALEKENLGSIFIAGKCVSNRF